LGGGWRELEHQAVRSSVEHQKGDFPILLIEIPNRAKTQRTGEQSGKDLLWLTGTLPKYLNVASGRSPTQFEERKSLLSACHLQGIDMAIL
jgi:hypothetical protein